MLKEFGFQNTPNDLFDVGFFRNCPYVFIDCSTNGFTITFYYLANLFNCLPFEFGTEPIGVGVLFNAIFCDCSDMVFGVSVPECLNNLVADHTINFTPGEADGIRRSWQTRQQEAFSIERTLQFLIFFQYVFLRHYNRHIGPTKYSFVDNTTVPVMDRINSQHDFNMPFTTTIFDKVFFI